MIKRKVIIFVGLYTLVAIGVLAASLNPGSMKDDTVLPAAKSLQYTEDEYNNVKNRYLTLAADNGFRQALLNLRDSIKVDPDLFRSCHRLTHDLGRQAFQASNNFTDAAKEQDEVCNSGYIHGVIESYFSETPDVGVAMKTVCNGTKQNYSSWECFHGVGHGAMFFTNNDLPKSIEMCNTLAQGFESATCINGAYMENFNSDESLHPSKYLDKSDPFFPCAEEGMVNKSDCFLYAPSYYLKLHPNQYREALEWCLSAPLGFVASCAHGVGNQTMKENGTDPKFVEAVCEQGGENLNNHCVNGMLGLQSFQFGSIEPVTELCPTLKETNRQLCLHYADASKGFFE